jgi:hypothetical protein
MPRFEKDGFEAIWWTVVAAKLVGSRGRDSGEEQHKLQPDFGLTLIDDDVAITAPFWTIQKLR